MREPCHVDWKTWTLSRQCCRHWRDGDGRLFRIRLWRRRDYRGGLHVERIGLTETTSRSRLNLDRTHAFRQVHVGAPAAVCSDMDDVRRLAVDHDAQQLTWVAGAEKGHAVACGITTVFYWGTRCIGNAGDRADISSVSIINRWRWIVV